MTTEDATLKYRVCYADTDAGGIVYHGRFLEMAERARNHLMYKAGLSFSILASKYGIMLIVHRVEATYYAPAMLEDLLELRSRVTRWRPSRSIWVTDLLRDNMLLARVATEIVALDANTRRLTRFPDAVIEMVKPYVTASAEETFPSNSLGRVRKRGWCGNTTSSCPGCPSAHPPDAARQALDMLPACRPTTLWRE